MSLCHEAVRLLVEQARTRGFGKVTAIWMELGAFSCVEADALRFCFTAAAKDSLAEGAELHLVRHDGQAWCYDCAKLVRVDKPGQACPRCAGYQLKLAQDDGLRIKQIEVE